MDVGISNFIEEFNERARKGLAAAPEIAVLVQGDSPDPSDQPFASDEHVCGAASVKYLLAPGRLLILRIPAQDGAEIESHARQIQILAGHIARKMQSDDRLQDAQVWPLHMIELSQAILFQQARVASDLSMYDNYVNVTQLLSISPPRHDGIFIAELRNNFGKDVGLIFSMAFFYARSLWALAPACVVLIIIGIVTPNSLVKTRLYIAQVIVVLWAIAVAYFGVKQFAPEKGGKLSSQRSMLTGIGHRSDRPWAERALKFVFVALPLVAVLFLCAFAAFGGVTVLILHVIYVWGDCLNEKYNPPFTENICRDPQVKHGFVKGLVAEIACDILLVIIFEIFLPLCEQLGNYIANLRNYDHEVDRRLLARTLTTFFACVESVGFRVCLAFIFVPQWNDPAMPAADANSPFCTDLSVGLWCKLQSDLDVEIRRDVFEKLLKGPFCVAPFIRILMKVIIPKLCDDLYLCFQRHEMLKHSVLCAPGRFLFRFLALIFTYEGGHVGCCQFLGRGWPFSELQVEQTYCPPPALEDTPAPGAPAPQAQGAEAGGRGCGDESAKLEKTEKRMQDAMEQFVSKRFEPESELLELKLSLLGVLFFGPVMPLGVLFTLFAIIIEIRTDLIKMLFVRRRTVPDDCSSMSKDFVHYLVAVSVCSVGWHVGLALVTYNDSLWKWETLGKVVTAGLGLWVLACFGLKLVLIDMHRSLATGRATTDGDGVQPQDEGTAI